MADEWVTGRVFELGLFQSKQHKQETHTYTASTACIVMVRVTAADICPMWIQRGRDPACVAKRGHKNHVSRMEGRVMTDFREFCEGIWTYTDIRDTQRRFGETLRPRNRCFAPRKVRL